LQPFVITSSRRESINHPPSYAVFPHIPIPFIPGVNGSTQSDAHGRPHWPFRVGVLANLLLGFASFSQATYGKGIHTARTAPNNFSRRDRRRRAEARSRLRGQHGRRFAVHHSGPHSHGTRGHP